jgi:predicted PurR-regulated permease PerM
MNKDTLAKSFILLLLAGILYLCYQIYRPFLVDIIAAAILSTIFYRPFEWIAVKFGNRRNLAALVTCLLIALVVIIPLANFLVYVAQRSAEAYDTLRDYIASRDIGDVSNWPLMDRFNTLGLSQETVNATLLQAANQVKDWLATGAGTLIKGTTNFFVSLFLIFFTMFFFFVDGQGMLRKLMSWTPLPNKYDEAIFEKFKNVSYSTIVSAFLTAIAQGLIGGLGFLVVGLPAFFPTIAMALLSLMPYIGAGIIWFPSALYLLFVGKIWQGIFLLIWGFAVISTVDNLIKGYIIKGKSHVHPIFIIFSIFGGIALFGFWGVFFGPLIISLAVTILHIYEVEFGIGEKN